MEKHQKQRRSFFTLIELLVVIAIIAILAAMLLPALARARDVAKSIKCTGNVKQLATSLLMYVDTYDGYMPCVYLGRYNASDTAVNTWFAWLLWQDKTMTINVLKCPSEKHWGHTAFEQNYGLSVTCGFGDNDYSDLLKLNQLKRPSSKIMLGDLYPFTSDSWTNITPHPFINVWSGHWWSGGLAFPGYAGGTFCQAALAGRHARKANVAWMDGHAGNLTVNEVNCTEGQAFYGKN